MAAGISGVYVREDQALITLQVWAAGATTGTLIDTGLNNGAGWATASGAELTAAANNTRPGGMGHQVPLGGPAARSALTMTVQQTDEILSEHSFLESRVGKAKALCTIAFLDGEGNVRSGAGSSISIWGALDGAYRGEQNYDSGAAVMYTVTIDTAELAAA